MLVEENSLRCGFEEDSWSYLLVDEDYLKMLIREYLFEKCWQKRTYCFQGFLALPSWVEPKSFFSNQHEFVAGLQLHSPPMTILCPLSLWSHNFMPSLFFFFIECGSNFQSQLLVLILNNVLLEFPYSHQEITQGTHMYQIKHMWAAVNTLLIINHTPIYIISHTHAC